VRLRPRRQWIGKVRDEHGDELAVRLIHFSQAQVTALPVGSWLRLYGEVRGSLFGREMIHPRMRTSQPGAPTRSGLTAVYPTVAGVAQPTIRRAVAAAFAGLDWTDTLDAATRARLGLPALREALARLHYPPSLPSAGDPAWQRVRFDELLAQRLSLRLARRARSGQRAVALPAGGRVGPDDAVARAGRDLVGALLGGLPFPLTGAQQRAWRHIAADLARPEPMQRLLQGDVGAGKTVVAAMACAARGGERLSGGGDGAHRVARRAASGEVPPMAGAARRACRRAAPVGRGRRSAGIWQPQWRPARWMSWSAPTHCSRRASSSARWRWWWSTSSTASAWRSGCDWLARATACTSLMMSATPIPRTLAMSYYADLDVSVIDELPPGRSPIVTHVIGNPRRGEVVARLAQACADGRQVYWVCPLVEELGDPAAAGRHRGLRGAAAGLTPACASASCTAACCRRRRRR
jgi:ATP-dependent DNA helicase RecG